MRRKILVIASSIVLVILLAVSVYQFETEPPSYPSVGLSSAYVLVHSRTHSQIVNVSLNVLLGSEKLMLGVESSRNITADTYIGIPLIIAKISQSTNFPVDSMSYVIESVSIYYNGSNQSLPINGPTQEGNYTMYIMPYSFNLLGNFTLLYYVHVAGIAQIGIYHYTGISYVFSIQVSNVSVMKV